MVLGSIKIKCMKKIVVVFFFSLQMNAQTGIGTTTPVNKFQVETAAAAPSTSGVGANGNLRLSATGANQVLDFGLGTTYSWLQSRDKTGYGTNYNLLLNPNGGNVGIGNNDPTDRLVVGASVAVHDGGNKVIGLGWSPGANKALLTGFPAEIRLDYATGKLSFGTSPSSVTLGSSTSIQNVMSLTSQGNVGIGTTAPTTNLHIQNGNTFGNPASTSSPSIYVYNSNNSSTSANSTISVRTAGTGSGKPYYSLDVNGAFGYSMGINNPTDQMIFNASWDFNTTSANNALIINRTGASRVIIPAYNGAYTSDWPGSWGGGLATYDICAAGILASGYNTRSDKRLKNTILTIENDAISKYLQLRPVTYYWNQDKPRDTKLQYGLIAQEVEAIFPEMVNTSTDEIQTKSVNYQALHALSLKVIQEQQKQIEDLQQKQAALEQRLLFLESKKE